MFGNYLPHGVDALTDTHIYIYIYIYTRKQKKEYTLYIPTIYVSRDVPRGEGFLRPPGKRLPGHGHLGPPELEQRSASTCHPGGEGRYSNTSELGAKGLRCKPMVPLASHSALGAMDFRALWMVAISSFRHHRSVIRFPCKTSKPWGCRWFQSAGFRPSTF